MRQLTSFVVLVVAAMLAWQPVLVNAAEVPASDDVWERRCGDDDGNDRCAPEVQKKMRDAYGLQDAKSLAENGTYARRAMIVDGYGRDVLAVSFIRERGRDPMVEIRVPQNTVQKQPNNLSMPISGENWEKVLRLGQFFDRDLTAIASDDEAISICLHAWVATAETADPRRLSRNTLPASELDSLVRSKTQSACGGGLAIDYAFELVDLAYTMLPPCQTLPLESYRNKTMALNNCLSLAGDRVAASQAAVLAAQIRIAMSRYPQDMDKIRDALEDVIVFPDLNDPSYAAKGSITKAQRDQMVDLFLEGLVYLGGFEGVDADHVTIEAIQFQRSKDSNESNPAQRKMTLFASMQADEFRIYRIDAGSFVKPSKEIE